MSSKLMRSIFVALCLVCLGCRERMSSISSATTHNSPTAVDAGRVTDVSASHNLKKLQEGGENGRAIMVYYFHRTARCRSCIAIESNAARTIENNFQEQLADGRLIWKPFNLDDVGGEEYKKKFDITFNTVVVAKKLDDNRFEYKKLDDVWQLLGDSEGFSEYVTDEIRKFLGDE